MGDLLRISGQLLVMGHQEAYHTLASTVDLHCPTGSVPSTGTLLVILSEVIEAHPHLSDFIMDVCLGRNQDGTARTDA